MMRALLVFFIFVAVVGVGLARDIGKLFVKPESAATVTPASARNAPPPPPVATSSRSIRLESDGRGHFQVEAKVDGRRIDFMVDTGASVIALRESSAARVGIFPKPSDYTGRAQTANGIAKSAPVMLNKVEINGIVVHDVAAHVLSDEALKVNLLGMSFLSKVKFTHDRGRLVLEQ